jgi:hypothetical protein
MTTILLLAVLLIRPGLCAESATAPPKAPPRTYHNPLLPDIEIADPFVLCVDGKYYLYPTSDARGYEVFVSGGLVHWERSRTAEGGLPSAFAPGCRFPVFCILHSAFCIPSAVALLEPCWSLVGALGAL